MMAQLSNYSTQVHFRQLHDHIATATAIAQASRRPKKQQQRRLSAREVPDILAAYEAGESLIVIGRRHRIGREQVSAILEKAGVPRRYRRLSPTDLAALPHLYAEGLSVAAIASRMKVHHETIRYHLLRLGVPMRDSHGRPRAAGES